MYIIIENVVNTIFIIFLLYSFSELDYQSEQEKFQRTLKRQNCKVQLINSTE